MSRVHQQENRPDSRARPAAPVQRARDRDKPAYSPRYGFAKTSPRHGFSPSPQRPSNGLPEPLRKNLETMSGVAMDDVRVHRNSSRPAALAALAFTQGSDIHLGPGQDEHLPHEAWHVVQQKQGRVTPTLQMKGISINDDRGLEREADAMGRLAAAGGAPRSSGGAPATAAAAPPGVVQRKVGFEFETNWLVSKNGQWLNKKDKVGTAAHQGFNVEADEAGEGRSEIEFVVHPPVEEGTGGQNALTGIMQAIAVYAQRLIAVAVNGQPVGLDLATGQQADSTFAVTSNGPLEAGPQATTGLDLAKIGRLGTIRKEMEAPQSQAVTALTGPRFGGPAPKELHRTLDVLQANAEAISELHPGISPQLQGLLVLIRNYLKAGADAYKEEDLTAEQRTMAGLNYPKRIADVVLARTDFARLFMMVPRGERRRFLADRSSWVSFVLKGLAHVKPRDSVIERGIQVDENDPSRGLVKPDLKVKDWLLGMLGTFGNEPKDDLPGIDRLAAMPGAESMGEFGAKTEKVGGTTSPLLSSAIDVGIFEFRGAQGTKIGLDKWAPFALAFHRYITAVHD